MAARAVLFVSKATIDWCVARYLSDDHPDNAETWARLPPFADANGVSTDAQRQQYQRYLSQRRDLFVQLEPGRNPNPFQADNWTAINVTGWQDLESNVATQAQIDAARMRTMTTGNVAFLRGLTSDTPTVQWGHVYDPELAQAWLLRAMLHTPDAIGRMAPADQKQAIDDMWASYAQFWKAMNLCPQAWGRYRKAWEYYARPATPPPVLDNTGAVWPRPFSAPIFPFSGTRATGGAQFYPPDAPRYWGPWRWEAVLASNALGDNSQGRIGHGYWDAAWAVTYGGSLREPRTALNSNPSYPCQSTVMFGGLYIPTVGRVGGISPYSCFAPMGEAHMYWLDNAALLGGGMDTVWSDGAIRYNTSVAGWLGESIVRDVTSYLVECPWNSLDVERPASAFYAVQPVAVADPSSTSAPGGPLQPTTPPWIVTAGTLAFQLGPARSSGAQTWRDGRLISFPGAPRCGGSFGAAMGCGSIAYGAAHDGYTGAPLGWDDVYGTGGIGQSRCLWQPPAKRYVDLLWPLLVYLSQIDDLAKLVNEVKIDVMGKNGYSLLAAGGESGQGSAGLSAAASMFSEQFERARERAAEESRRALDDSMRPFRLALGLASAAFGLAGPAAAPVVAAGFAFLNGTIAFAQATGTNTPQWVSTPIDVFGRPDGTQDGNRSLGNYERFALYNVRASGPRGFTGADIEDVAANLYQLMRLKKRTGTSDNVNDGWERFREGFWVGRDANGNTGTAAALIPYPAGMYQLAATVPTSLLVRPGTSTSTSTGGPPRRLRNLAPKPSGVRASTAASAAVAGIALGALASEVTRGSR